MIKILFVQGTGDRAGAERIFFSLLKQLDRAHFEPVVAFMSQGSFLDEVQSLGVETYLVSSCPRVREVWRWGPMVKEIEGLIQEVTPDIVCGNGERVSVFTGRASRAQGTPSVAWLQDSPGATGITSWGTQLALRSASNTSVVVCANWMEREFARSIGLKSTTIVSGIDLDEIPGPNPSVKQIKADQGWPEDCLVVSHFARLQRWKGTEIFVRAAQKVLSSQAGVRFLVVGDAMYGREAGYADELKALARDLDLEDRFVFLGYRLDALEIMAGSDIVVHCSVRPDPFPTVILEGMALERAVIATRSKGPEESMIDRVTGLLVDPGDVGQLTLAIQELLDSSELRTQLGKAGAESVRQRFSAQLMARGFEQLFANLVPGKHIDSEGISDSA